MAKALAVRWYEDKAWRMKFKCKRNGDGVDYIRRHLPHEPEYQRGLSDLVRPWTSDDRATLRRPSRLFPESDHVVSTFGLTGMKVKPWREQG